MDGDLHHRSNLVFKGPFVKPKCVWFLFCDEQWHPRLLVLIFGDYWRSAFWRWLNLQVMNKDCLLSGPVRPRNGCRSDQRVSSGQTSQPAVWPTNIDSRVTFNSAKSFGFGVLLTQKTRTDLRDLLNSSAGPKKLPSGSERASWFDPATNKKQRRTKLNPSTIADQLDCRWRIVQSQADVTCIRSAREYKAYKLSDLLDRL